MTRTIGTNSDIAIAWRNGQAMRSHNGNFSTDGQSAWSYRMLIGRTLEDGTKQYLDVTGHHSYSVTTSQHVSNLRWQWRYDNANGFKIERIAPVNIQKGYGSWRNFPSNNACDEIRATSQVWKTEKGAKQNMGEHQHIISTYGGYTLGYYQYTDDMGHTTDEQTYLANRVKLDALIASEQ